VAQQTELNNDERDQRRIAVDMCEANVDNLSSAPGEQAREY
jgi:hypothetical protein